MAITLDIEVHQQTTGNAASELSALAAILGGASSEFDALTGSNARAQAAMGASASGAAGLAAAAAGAADGADALAASLLATQGGAGAQADAANAASAAMQAQSLAAQAVAASLAEQATAARGAVEASNGLGGVAEKLLAQADAAQKAAAALAEQAVEARRAADAGEGIAGVADDLEAQAKAAQDAADALTEQADAADESAKANDAMAGKISKAQGAFGDLGGPVGALGESILRPIKGFRELSGVIGSGGAAAIGATAAIAALGVAALVAAAAIAAVTAATAALALKLADTRRAAALTSEAFFAMNPALASVRGEMSSLTNDTGVSEDRLRDLAKALSGAKVSAEQLPGALRAAALAEAALGQGGADEFISQISAGKLAVDEFTTNAQQKLGGTVRRQMLGLDNQAATLKRNLAGLFGGVDPENALTGVSKLVKLFDQGEASGKAIKLLFEKFFQPLIDSVSTAATAVEAFVLGVLIGLVGLYIKLKPVIKAVSEFFGFDDPATEDTFKAITAAGEVVALVIAGIAASFLVVAALFAGAVALIALPFVAAGMAIYNVVQTISEALDAVGAAFTEAYNYVAAINWSELGTALMNGLASGITSAVGAVVKAVTGAVTATIGAAKELLGISSPSKVFMSIGGDTGEGFVGGIEGEQDAAQGAIESLVEPPASAPDIPLGELAAEPAPELAGADGMAAPALAPAAPAEPAVAEQAAAAIVPSDTERALAVDTAPDTGASVESDERGADDEPRAPSGGMPLGESALASLPAMSAATPTAAPTATPSASPQGGGSKTIDLSGATFTFNGVADAEQAEERFSEALTKLLEGDAMSLGAT